MESEDEGGRIQPKRARVAKSEARVADWNAPRDDPGPISPCPSVSRNRQRLVLRDAHFGAGPHSALSVWQRLFPETLLSLIVEKTSVRLVARHEPPITTQDFYVWLALLMTMGIRRLPSSKHFWARDSFGKAAISLINCEFIFVPFAVYGTSSFGTYMSRDRWHHIKWCLTVIDEEADAPKVPATDPTYDRLWRFRPFLTGLEQAFSAAVKPGVEVSLDEMMVKCKGESYM